MLGSRQMVQNSGSIPVEGSYFSKLNNVFIFLLVSLRVDEGSQTPVGRDDFFPFSFFRKSL